MATDGYARRWNQFEYPAEAERFGAAVTLMPGASTQPFSARAGKRPNSAGLAVTVGGDPEKVTITPGAGVIFDGNVSATPWDFTLPSAITLDLPARPSSGNSRRDLIVARIYDPDSGLGSVREMKIERIGGTPGSNPSAPQQPALSLRLAELLVPDSGSITVTANRARTVAAGGVLPVETTTERDAVAGTYPGLVVYNAQTGQLEVRTGSAWVPVAPVLSRQMRYRPTNLDAADGSVRSLEAWDNLPGSPIGSDITFASGAWTIQKTGIYSVELQVLWNTSSSGNRRADILLNDSIETMSYGANGGRGTCNAAITQQMDAGTKISVQVTQTSGGTLSVLADNKSTRITIQRVA